MRVCLQQVEYHDNCAYDYVEIRDGSEVHSPLLARLCGYKLPEDVRSSSNRMFVRFVSDSSVLKMGFSANFISGNYSNKSILEKIKLTL